MRNQWRKIYTSFYENETLGLLPLQIRYLLKGLIVFADDFGRFRANPKLIRNKIFPFDAFSDEEIGLWMRKLQEKSFIFLYDVDEQPYGYHAKWSKYNKARKDRKQAEYPPPPRQESGQPNDNQLATNGQPDDAPDKNRVDKSRREERRGELAANYLLNIPDFDLQEFSTRFNCSPAQIKSKAEDLLNWCKANGTWKKDYKAFLRNALKKDFGDRPPAPKAPPKVEIAPEQIAKNKEALEKLKVGVLKEMPKLEEDLI